MLNYASKALDAFDAIRPFFAANMPGELVVLDWARDVLTRSVKFCLPDDGMIFEPGAAVSYPEQIRGARLPFPAIAIEFALNPGIYPVMADAPIPCPRRLAIAVDLLDPAEYRHAREAFKSGLDFVVDKRLHLAVGGPAACLMLSIDYSGLDEPHVAGIRDIFKGVGEVWMPAWAACALPYDQYREGVTPHRLDSPKIVEGRYSPRVTLSMEPVVYGSTGLKLLEAADQYDDLSHRQGEFVLEAGTLLSLVIALGHGKLQVAPASEKLQKARFRRGQRPLFDYYVLDMTAGPSPATQTFRDSPPSTGCSGQA